MILTFFMQCAAKKELASLRSAHQTQQQELSQAQQRNESLNQQMNGLQQQVERLQKENEQMQSALSEARASLADMSEQLDNCPEAMVDGVVFKVQIGAFEQRELDASLDASVNLGVESEESLDRMVVGQFRDYYAADALQEQLRAMGVETAWIVPYKDGNRVSLEEVLPEVETQP